MWTASTVIYGNVRVSCDSLGDLDALASQLSAREDVTFTRDDVALSLIATVVQHTTSTGIAG